MNGIYGARSEVHSKRVSNIRLTRGLRTAEYIYSELPSGRVGMAHIGSSLCVVVSRPFGVSSMYRWT